MEQITRLVGNCIVGVPVKEALVELFEDVSAAVGQGGCAASLGAAPTNSFKRKARTRL